MRKTRIVAALLLALAGLVVTAPPAAACAENPRCELINEVCHTAFGVYCLR